MNTRQVLEAFEAIIHDEFGHLPDRDLDRLRRWLERSLEHHAFVDHVARTAERAARSFGLPNGWRRIDLRETIYCALDGISTYGDLEHRSFTNLLGDPDLAAALRLVEIACDHYDGKPLDVALTREDLQSARRWASTRHLRVAE